MRSRLILDVYHDRFGGSTCLGAASLIDGLAAHRTVGAGRRTELEWVASHRNLVGFPAGQKLFQMGEAISELFMAVTVRLQTIPLAMMVIAREEFTQPSAVQARLDSVWNPTLRKAMARNRDERYQTAREFAPAVRDAPVR